MKNFNIPLELSLVRNATNAIKTIAKERDSHLITRIEEKLKAKADELHIGLDVLILSCFIKGQDNEHLTAIALDLVKEIPIGTLAMRDQIDSFCQFKALELFAKEKLAYFESRIEQAKS